MPIARRTCQRFAAQRGVTLIELMIAVAIVAILATIGMPIYQDSIRKARRSEAFNALNGLQQAQERWRGNNPAYSISLTELAASSPTASGNYQLSVAAAASVPLNVGYVATATAAGDQAADTRCAILAARIVGGTLSYGSGSSAIDWSDNNRCWAK